jgi:outer membrane protein assembly factor BamB
MKFHVIPGDSAARAPGSRSAIEDRAVSRLVIGVVVLACAAGCGARTDLNSPRDGGTDAAVPPPENACASAVDPAAPTPMRGYCSTRAHLAPHGTPSAPVMGWVTPLETDYEPIELVVDGAGHTYATIDPVRGDDVLSPHTLVILDAGGSLVATRDFRPDVIGGLFLAPDGLLSAQVGVDPRRLVRIGLDAVPTELGMMPPHSFRFAIASDGTLVTSLVDFHSPDRLARVSPDGTVLWESEPIDDGTCGGCISEVALWPDDRIVVMSLAVDPVDPGRGRTTAHGLSAGGAETWQRTIDGILTQGPAIASDGTLRMVTGVTDEAGTTTTIVSSLTDRGEMAWQTRLPEDYEQTWDHALPIAPDGTTFVHTFRALTAIGPDGAVRWRIETPTNLSYDAVVDTHGTLAAMLGPIRGLDVATGEELWHVDGPGPVDGTLYYISNLVLAPEGCLLGASHGGTLFSACDP